MARSLRRRARLSSSFLPRLGGRAVSRGVCALTGKATAGPGWRFRWSADQRTIELGAGAMQVDNVQLGLPVPMPMSERSLCDRWSTGGKKAIVVGIGLGAFLTAALLSCTVGDGSLPHVTDLSK